MQKPVDLKYIIFVLCMLISASCEKNDIDSKLGLLDKTDYFPLHVGDYWEYELSSKRTIEREIELYGFDYFQVNSVYDTILYRKTPDGKVYERINMGTERLRFDLNAHVGESWTYRSLLDATLISKNETVYLEHYVFVNCYKYRFDTPQVADDEETIWLAPGIGIVAIFCSGCGGGGRYVLKKSNINGVEIQF